MAIIFTMKFTTKMTQVLAIFILGSSCTHAAVIFNETFTSTTLVENDSDRYLGGYYGHQIVLGTWNASTSGEVSITVGALGTLNVRSTSGGNTRSAGIILNPSAFAATGAGDYTLTFDLTAFVNDENKPNATSKAVVSVWSGKGYDDPGLNNANALVLHPLYGSLDTLGAASSVELASNTFDSAGNGYQVNFTYDGTGVVALFFGATSTGYPFPNASFDNIQLATAVPEASTAAFCSLLIGIGCLRRNRSKI